MQINSAFISVTELLGSNREVFGGWWASEERGVWVEIECFPKVFIFCRLQNQCSAFPSVCLETVVYFLCIETVSG